MNDEVREYMNWFDTEEIAEQLDQTYPDIDPMDLSPVHLERMIVELPDFHAKNASADQTVLLKIQKEWNRIRQ